MDSLIPRTRRQAPVETRCPKTGRQSLWLAAAVAALWLAAFFLFAWPRRTFGWHIDLFQFFNWINAVDHGQVPSRDFHTPFGALAHYLLFWGYVLADGFGGALEMASVLALAILLPCGAVILANRTSLPVALAVATSAAALVVVPWNPGDGAWVISQQLFYNRWCWCALALLFLVFLPVKERGRATLEGMIIGVLLLFLFFLKLTYFAVGTAFVGLFGLGLKRFPNAAAIGLGVLAATVAGVQVVLGSVDGYLADLWITIQATGILWTGAGSPFQLNLLASWPQFAALAIACCCALPESERPPDTPGKSRGNQRRAPLDRVDWCFILFATASSAVLLGQNGAQACVYALLAPLVRLIRACNGWRAGIAGAALASFLVPPLLAQAVAAHAFAVGHPHFAPMNLPRTRNVYFPRGKRPELDELQSGVDLLRKHAVAAHLAAFDFANWFPALLDAPPRPGRLWCFYVGRAISLATAPTAPEMLRGARYVMIPKLGAAWARNPNELGELDPSLDITRAVRSSSRDFLLGLYGEALRQRYVLLDENAHWRLYAERSPATGLRPAP